MARRLVWSNRSLVQRLEIFNYWNERNQSKSYSNKLERLFQLSAELIQKYPHLGIRTKRDDIRLKLVRDYWIVYHIQPTKIIVLRIWDTRQDPDKLTTFLQNLKK